MVPILHTAGTWLSSHAAPLVALAVALVGAGFGQGRAATLAPGFGALALLAGWSVLLGAASLPRALWAPHRGAEVLLGVAAASGLVAAAMAWRGGRNRRLLLVADAGFAGWWVAHSGVSDADFWRAGFAVLVLAVWLGWAIRSEALSGLATGLALLGGLFAAQAGTSWIVAAAVASAAWAGVLAIGKGGALPAAPVAALVVATDLAGGRALRGRVDGTDLACVATLLAPFAVRIVARKIGAKNDRFLMVLAAAATAAGLGALVWLLRRAISG